MNTKTITLCLFWVACTYTEKPIQKPAIADEKPIVQRWGIWIRRGLSGRTAGPISFDT